MDPLENKIEELLRADLSCVTVGDLVAQIDLLTVGHAIVAPNIPVNSLLFRGRVVEYASLVSELSFPPITQTKLGRVNDEGESFFYASFDRRVVFFECPIEVGTTILVSRWRTTAEMLVNHVGYHDDVFTKLGSARELASYDGKSNQEYYPKASAPLWHGLAKLFTGDASKYKLSVAVAKCMLSEQFAGLLYPSISMFANADNIALKSTWVEHNLRFVGVEKIIIKSIDGPVIQSDCVDYATSPDQRRLSWKGEIYSWEIPPGKQYSLRNEQDRNVMRDENGSEVDPV